MPWINGENLSGENLIGPRSGQIMGPVPDDRRVYCNRTMDLSKIEAVGFDMVRLAFHIQRHAGRTVVRSCSITSSPSELSQEF